MASAPRLHLALLEAEDRRVLAVGNVKFTPGKDSGSVPPVDEMPVCSYSVPEFSPFLPRPCK